MKKLFIIPLMLVALLTSCDDINNDYTPICPTSYNAIVTTKTSESGTFFLQLDNSTTLLPINIKHSPYGNKEMRALVNFDYVGNNGGSFTKAVRVYQMDSILTKRPVANLGDNNDKTYGNDPVDIVNDWMTVAEDGFLTLRFRARWGMTGVKHTINLVATGNDANPYQFELRHNAFGDLNGVIGDALVAFNLNSLPDTAGKTVKLSIIWMSTTGKKTHEFDFCSRKSSGSDQEILNGLNETQTIE